MSPKENKDGTVTVNVDDFTRTRDSVLVSLAQLNSAVADLSRAYINHANTVLGRSPAELDLGIINSGITNALYDHGLIGRASSPGAKSEAGAAPGDKKKRKRAPPDPNAPKRALTPYFLYMQHNRAQIATDLGGNSRPRDVADEGTRRWSTMPEAQKAVWKKLYLDNLAVYREKMHDYKEKKEQEKGQDHDQAASSQLQQDVATAEQSGSDEESESEQEEEEQHPESSPSPEPRKEPTPPRSTKRRRSDAAKSTPKAAPAEESPAANKSPEKKKRGSVRKDKEKEKEEEVPASARKGAGADSKRPKKKRKSDAAGEE